MIEGPSRLHWHRPRRGPTGQTNTHLVTAGATPAAVEAGDAVAIGASVIATLALLDSFAAAPSRPNTMVVATRLKNTVSCIVVSLCVADRREKKAPDRAMVFI